MQQSALAAVVVGDVHAPANLAAGLPGWACFLSELARRPPCRLIILGDLFEYWLDTPLMVQRYDATFHHLRRLHQLGWQIDLIVGNREILAGRWLQRAGKLRLHWPLIDLHLAGRRLRIMHGDRLCADTGYHALFALLHGFWITAWSWFLPATVQDRIAGDMRDDSQRRNHSPHSRSWQAHAAQLITAPRLAGAWRDCDLLLAGHIHQRWHFTSQVPRRRLSQAERQPGQLWLVGDWHGWQGSWVEVAHDGTCQHLAVDYAIGQRRQLAQWPTQCSTRPAAATIPQESDSCAIT